MTSSNSINKSIIFVCLIFGLSCLYEYLTRPLQTMDMIIIWLYVILVWLRVFAYGIIGIALRLEDRLDLPSSNHGKNINFVRVTGICQYETMISGMILVQYNIIIPALSVLVASMSFFFVGLLYKKVATDDVSPC